MLKHHWPYIFSMVFFILLIVVILPLQINKYLTLKDDVDISREEANHLKDVKAKLLSYKGINLDKDIKTLTEVFPDKPDRFSLFSNISLLQKQDELLIQNFSSPFNDLSDEKIGINVRSIATLQGFKNLLSNYFFKTGKLITLDSIFYDMEKQDLTFTVYYHSKQIGNNEGNLVKRDDKEIAFVQNIRKNIALLNIGVPLTTFSDNDSALDDYSSKPNPFQN